MQMPLFQALRSIKFFKRQMSIFSVIIKSLESKDILEIRVRSGFRNLNRFGSM